VDGARLSCQAIVPDDRGGVEECVVQTAVVLLWNDGAGCSDGVGFGAYRGKDSAGLGRRNPLSCAAFSPCLPNPYPLLEVAVVDLDTPLSPVCCWGM